ncbi:MAG: HNH endonuclease [Desulfobacteraceae bacterium]|nr:HNH endonuclease [Desulfobacteraceae bacterium]
MSLPRIPSRTMPGFVFSVVDRCLKDCIAKRKFGKKEIQKVIEFFGNKEECVFCGSKEVKRWDHLVPVAKGGETMIGNIVPSCNTCDDSKGDRSFENWMQSDCPGSPKSRLIPDIGRRIKRIEEYVAHFNYVILPLEDRLDADETEKLRQIRDDAQFLRSQIEELIAQYRQRTG